MGEQIQAFWTEWRKERRYYATKERQFDKLYVELDQAAAVKVAGITPIRSE